MVNNALRQTFRSIYTDYLCRYVRDAFLPIVNTLCESYGRQNQLTTRS